MTVYTPEQIAQRWGCDAKTVRNMLNDGALTGFRVGQKLWRIRAEKLEEYELCQTGASHDSGENSQSLGTNEDLTGQSDGVIPFTQPTGKRRNAAPRLDTRNSPARKERR